MLYAQVFDLQSIPFIYVNVKCTRRREQFPSLQMWLIEIICIGN